MNDCQAFDEKDSEDRKDIFEKIRKDFHSIERFDDVMRKRILAMKNVSHSYRHVSRYHIHWECIDAVEVLRKYNERHLVKDQENRYALVERELGAKSNHKDFRPHYALDLVGSCASRLVEVKGKRSIFAAHEQVSDSAGLATGSGDVQGGELLCLDPVSGEVLARTDLSKYTSQTPQSTEVVPLQSPRALEPHLPEAVGAREAFEAKSDKTSRPYSVRSLLVISTRGTKMRHPDLLLAGLENSDLVYLELDQRGVPYEAESRSAQVKFLIKLESPALCLLLVKKEKTVIAGLENGDIIELDYQKGRSASEIASIEQGDQPPRLVVQRSVLWHGAARVGAAVRCLLYAESESCVFAGLATGDIVKLECPRGRREKRWSVGFQKKFGEVAVRSLLHLACEKRVFAGLENGDLVVLDIQSNQVVSRTNLGGCVLSLMQVDGKVKDRTYKDICKKRFFAGLENGEIVSVDVASCKGGIAQRPRRR
jgi:hypothetical protein